MKSDWLHSENVSDDVRVATTRLLDAARAAPPSLPGSKARVRAGIDQRPPGMAMGRLLFASTAVVVLGGIAALVIARGRPQSQPARTPQSAPQSAPRPVAPAASSLSAPPIAVDEAVPARHIVARHRAAATVASPVDDAAANALVVEAVRRLRMDHDGKGAIALVDRYLAAHPDGALVEEASALGVEAASTFDCRLAATRAARYLAQFPDGRFAGRAHAALAE